LSCLAAFVKFNWHSNKNQFEATAKSTKYWFFNCQTEVKYIKANQV